MCTLKYLFSLFLLLCALSLGADQTQELTSQSLIIKDKLLSLKQETENLQNALLDTTARLDEASQNFAISQAERNKWEAQSMSLSSSLTSINEELNNSFVTITQQEVKLRQLTSVVMMLSVILVIWIALKLVRIFVPIVFPLTKPMLDKLPRIVDIII